MCRAPPSWVTGPRPEIESIIDPGCITGLGSVGDRMLILLDIEQLMSSPGMGLSSNDG
jgi:purine-binding chemotaxis protein CheW